MAVAVSNNFSPLPATRTLSALKKEVTSYVSMPSGSNALEVAERGIQNAVRRINSNTWKWAVTYHDITTSAAFDFDLPRDVRAPLHLELLNDEDEPAGRLEYKTPKDFLVDHISSTDDGDPSVYTIADYDASGVLTLDIKPSSAFIATYPTMRLWYMRKVLPPVSDAEHVQVPSEFELFLTWYAKWEMASQIDPRKAEFAERQWRELEQKLLVEENEQHDWAEYV